MQDFVLKIIGMGLLVSVSHQILLKSGRDEQAMLITLAGIVAVLLVLIGEIATLIETIRSVFGI